MTQVTQQSLAIQQRKAHTGLMNNTTFKPVTYAAAVRVADVIGYDELVDTPRAKARGF